MTLADALLDGYPQVVAHAGGQGAGEDAGCELDEPPGYMAAQTWGDGNEKEDGHGIDGPSYRPGPTEAGDVTASAADTCWGKSQRGAAGWLPLAQHLADSQAVMGHLWDQWVPLSVKARIEADLPPETARALATVLAGWHDVGKATPAFAVQVPDLLVLMQRAGLTVPHPSYVAAQRRGLPHALAGAHGVHGWLTSRGWTGPHANALAAIVGGHHGAPPDALSEPDPALMGGPAWTAVREDLLERALDVALARPSLDLWREQPPGRQAAVLLSALVIVADWLASNTDLFPYDVVGSAEERAGLAWQQLGLPAPWRPGPVDLRDDGYWTGRFGIARPRPVQLAVHEALTASADPRLLIVEAPMGEGKTEAALAAAEALAHRHGCGGVLVALPTMATSNAMFARLLTWLDHLPPAEDGGAWSTYLAHGKAGLNDAFRGLHDAALQGVGDDEDDRQGGAAVAHAWLSGRKKGVLSTFVVGTIDQVLVGALRSRHLALRHLSLAGKVVVLDEVHASDEYMAVFLDRVLSWLGAYRVPVVLLSATLPPQRRTELVQAYLAGHQPAHRDSSAGTHGADPAGYPLLTVVDGLVTRSVAVPPSGRSSQVRVEPLGEEDLVAELVERLADGGTAAVVCNTVARAQERAGQLTSVLGADVLLLHSRFLASDRATLERQVLTLLGPPGSASRPRRLVLVGTQVLEQSLDIDVDLMVTDLAPVDLVLQRAGRLHRHARPAQDRPTRLRHPQLLVTGVEDWGREPPLAVRGSRAVYGDAALLRSVTVLRPHLQGRLLAFPDDIAPLVRAGYAPYDPAGDWPVELAEAQAEADRGRAERQHRAGSFLLGLPTGERQHLLGWLGRSTDEQTAAGQAAVRDGTQGVEVLLLQDRDGALHLPEHVPYGGARVGSRPQEHVALAALGCAVRLPERCTRVALATPLTRPEWKDDRWLREVLVLPCAPDGEGLLRGRLGSHELRYDLRGGLTVTSGGTR